MADSRLIVALDVRTMAEVRALVEQLGETVSYYKVGMELFYAVGRTALDYLHDEGIRINTGVSNSKLGMSYEITYKGQYLATIANSSPKGKSILTTDMYYDVTCEEKDLDLVFLTAFSIAKTDQTFYN